MAEKGFLIMSQRDLNRLFLIKGALGGEVTQATAAELLGLSVRQIRRMVQRVKIEGDRGIIHRSRGRPSNRRLPGEMREKVIALYRKKYNDFGPTLASEKLFEIDQIKVNEETLRVWLIGSGDWKGSRKGRKHRRWRERKNHFGEMVQIDGSHHDWFEGRGEKAVLMGYIDDATGKVFCRFYSYEGTIPVMDSFKRYVRKYGIPASVYLDMHSTYKSTAKPTTEENLRNAEPLSEFERAMKELGVQVIHAMSPQAKGRIERLFGTLQDRLVKEMRLKGISNIEEANEFLKEYLPKHNRRFAIAPEERENLHRRVSKGMNLDRVLCIKSERTLKNDFTVSYENKIYQIEERISAKKVIVEEMLNGSIVMRYKGSALRIREIETRSRAEKEPHIVVLKKRWRPSAEHPWRQGFKRVRGVESGRKEERQFTQVGV